MPWGLELVLVAAVVGLIGGPVAVILSQVGSSYGVNATAVLTVDFLTVPIALLAGGGAAGLRLLALRLGGRAVLEALAVAVGSLLGGAVGSVVLAGGLPSWGEALLESTAVGALVAVFLVFLTADRSRRLRKRAERAT